MRNSAVSRRTASLFVAGALVLASVFTQPVSASSTSARDGDKCTKLGAKTPGKSGVTLTCTRIGKTKVLKWKVSVLKSTKPAVTTTSQIIIEGSSFFVAGKVKSADSVGVTNRDGFTHTVTSNDGDFNITVAAGATESLPSLRTGTYAFHCAIHTSMRGTLTVG